MTLRDNSAIPNPYDALRADELRRAQEVPAEAGLANTIATPRPDLRYRTAAFIAKATFVLGAATAALGAYNMAAGSEELDKAEQGIIQEIRTDVDMRDVDTTIASGDLISDPAQRRFAAAKRAVGNVITSHEQELTGAVMRSAGGVGTAVLGLGMVGSSLLLGGATHLAGRRRHPKTTAIQLMGGRYTTFDLLYQEPLIGKRRVSTMGPEDTSPILELRPKASGGMAMIRGKAMRFAVGGSAVLLSALVAGGTQAGGEADHNADAAMEAALRTPAGSRLIEKSTPDLEKRINDTALRIVEEKLPKTNERISQFPTLEAQKADIVRDLVNEVYPQVNTDGNRTPAVEFDVFANAHDALAPEPRTWQYYTILGCVVSLLASSWYVMRRKPFLGAASSKGVQVSEQFLRTHTGRSVATRSEQ